MFLKGLKIDKRCYLSGDDIKKGNDVDVFSDW